MEIKKAPPGKGGASNCVGFVQRRHPAGCPAGVPPAVCTEATTCMFIQVRRRDAGATKTGRPRRSSYLSLERVDQIELHTVQPCIFLTRCNSR